MTRIRKEPNRYWSKEDKEKIINEVLLNCKSTEQVAKEYDISGGMLRGWIIKYNKEGQTRKQELLEEEYNSLTEDEKRIYQRNQA